MPQAVAARRLRRVFTDIYRDNGWGEGETRSGPGSTRERTAAFRDDLDRLLGELGVRSLLDLGCGEFNWQPLLAHPLERYVGVEIVPDIVRELARRHSAPGREFLSLNLIFDPLPACDLALCRDCLVHLANQHVLDALRNVRRSGTRFLLATTFTGRSENPDVPSGGWRPLNLERPPFSLPPPARLLSERRTVEDGRYADKALGLWSASDLPA